MNILHLSPFVPDVRASHAGGVCMGKQVETLKKNHHVTVLTFCNNEYEEKLLKDHPDFYYVKTTKWTFIANSLLHPSQPIYFGVRQSKTYKDLVRKLIKENNIEAVHAEYTSMGQYYWIKEEYPNIIFNITEHDVTIQSYTRQCEEAKGLMKLYLSCEKKKVEKKERECLKHADHVMTFNDKDVQLLKDYYHLDNVECINPYYGIEFDEIKTNIQKQEKSICFVGQMAREENHIAAMRLIKIIQEINDSTIHLNIIGAHPRKELLDCESKNIHITGFVEDINEEIQKNQIAVFPLTYGAGIKLKVLLAFGLGLPVITSSIGAEGIDEDGNVLLLAESDEEFKQQIMNLMNDSERIKILSEKSSQYVQDKFNWDKTVEVFHRIYG